MELERRRTFFKKNHNSWEVYCEKTYPQNRLRELQVCSEFLCSAVFHGGDLRCGRGACVGAGLCTWNDQFMRWDCPAGYSMNVPAPQWTAIAFSESTLHSGGSNRQATQGAAEDLAKSNCRSAGATDCNVLISRSNQCLALAVSDADDVWGYAGDDNRDQAAEEASTECRGVKANSCMVQAAQCASDNPVYPPPALALPHRAGVDPIVGCFQWFKGSEVFVLPNNKALSGPFVPSWLAVNEAQRNYAITWPQSTLSKVAISADARSLSGTNQYGGNDSATRISGSSGLVRVWNWTDVVTSKVTVVSSGMSNLSGTFRSCLVGRVVAWDLEDDSRLNSLVYA